MTNPAEPVSFPKGACWYGMQELPPLLFAFRKEISGVKAAQDIEHIHRMRVASRRLRAALPLFRSCFLNKQYVKWMSEITKITRALGEARDADVQIAFLHKLERKQNGKDGLHDKGTPAAGHHSSPAIQYLLHALQKKRGLLQERVLSALSELEKSQVMDEMQVVFDIRLAEIQKTRRLPDLTAISPVAALRTGQRLASLLAFRPWVTHPEAVAEHHATRIAAKKLRYTLEIYGPVYRNCLKKPLMRTKRIQEILGDLHDCDVWIDQVTRILLRERTLLRTKKWTKRPDTVTLSSLKVFLHEREQERRRMHRQFVRYWTMLERVKLWEELRSTLVNGQKKRFRPPVHSSVDKARAACTRFGLLLPELVAHSGTVTRLALRLFDELQPLHMLGHEDSFLLECAGILHDIGWKEGRAGHGRRSMEMIFADEDLPFGLADRGVIGLVAFSHRGKAGPDEHPFFKILSPEYQNKALVLAAILRIADGLDYLHAGSVEDVHCTISEKNVVCTIVAQGNVTAEKARAGKKADLFCKVCGRELVL